MALVWLGIAIMFIIGWTLAFAVETGTLRITLCALFGLGFGFSLARVFYHASRRTP